MHQSDTYFVYENWQAEGHKARIHRANCPSCNNGKGIHPGAGEDHGRWHGPFNSLQEARATAQASGGLVSMCKRCNPQ